MAYYFECKDCSEKKVFCEDQDKDVPIHEGKKQEYETVVCTACMSKKIRLKGNYIII